MALCPSRCVCLTLLIDIVLLGLLEAILSECIEPSIEPVHPYRAQIRVSGTAVSRTGGRTA